MPFRDDFKKSMPCRSVADEASVLPTLPYFADAMKNEKIIEQAVTTIFFHGAIAGFTDT